MPEYDQHVASAYEADYPWWVPTCRRLWKAITLIGGISVLVGIATNVLSTWLTSSKGVIPADSPWSTLLMHWPITLPAGVCLLLLGALVWAISRWGTIPQMIPDALSEHDRLFMLRRLRLRYEQVLSQSLQEAVQMELGLISRPAAVQNAVSFSLHLPKQPEQLLPPHTSIIEAYELAQQELLILGEPGAGKSTLLLELAHHLVEQSEQDAAQPLPVLLPLSSWATNPRPLQYWLSEQFARLYDVPRALSQQWVQADQLLFLLDGLDEMEESARPGCIAAINAYHREHLCPLAVCSRTQEYDIAAKRERLALHSAVTVQPLSYVLYFSGFC